MKKIEHLWQEELQKSPERAVRLIVRIKGDMAPAMARLTDFDATVLHSFRLSNSLAISCSAQTALALSQEPWVQAIEEDRRVSVQQETGSPPSGAVAPGGRMASRVPGGGSSRKGAKK